MKKFRNPLLQDVTIKKQLSKIGLLSILLLSISCVDDEMNREIQDVSDQNSVNLLSREQMLKNGWRIIPIHHDSTRSKNKPVIVQSRRSNVEIPLTREHLRDIGYDLNNPIDVLRLKKEFSSGLLPALNVRFNSSFSVHQNLFNKSVGNVSVTTSTPQLEIIENGFGLPDERSASFTLTNRNSRDVTMTRSFTQIEGYTTTQTLTTTASIRTQGQINASIPVIEGFRAGLSMELTLGITNSNAVQNIHQTQNTNTISITVPGRTQLDIIILAKRNRSTLRYLIPTVIKGNVVTNYFGLGDRNSPITNFPNFAKNVRNEGGVISIISIGDVEAFVSEDRPI